MAESGEPSLFQMLRDWLGSLILAMASCLNGRLFGSKWVHLLARFVQFFHPGLFLSLSPVVPDDERK